MDIVLIVLSILSISLFFNQRFKLNAAAAPMFTIAIITLFLCMLGMLDLLVVGCYIVFAGAVASLVYVFLIKRYSLKEIAKDFLTPGVAFFVAATVLFYFLLSSKNAAFRVWDEFTFWGPAAKITFLENSLYTFQKTSIVLSYQPALPVFSYFVQFFTGSFSEWKVYLAYDMMAMAALSTIFARIKWKNVVSILTAAAFSLLGIYIFFESVEGLRAYATSYADMQLGFLFGGALLMWFHSEKKSFMRYFSSLAVLLLVIFTKETGLPFAMIGAVIIVADMFLSSAWPSDTLFEKSPAARKLAVPGLLLLFSVAVFFLLSQKWGLVLFAISLICAMAVLFVKKLPYPAKLEKAGKVLLRIFFILLLFVAIAALYRLWTIHYDLISLHQSNRDPNLKVSFMDILAGRSSYFKTVFAEMISRFFNYKLTALGPAHITVIVFTIVPILASLFTKDRKKIARTSTFSVLAALGFFAYLFFLAYLYVAIFPDYIALGLDFDLPSYNRYVSSYAIGWMFGIFGMLFFDIAKPFFKRWFLRFSAAITAVVALLVASWYFNPNHPDQYLLTSSKVTVGIDAPRPQYAKYVTKYQSAFTNDDTIYLINHDISSPDRYILCYELYPAIILEELGTFVPLEENDPDHHLAGMTPALFSEYLRENDVDYIFIDHNIGGYTYFLETFSDMFEDGGLFLALEDSTRLFSVEDSGEGLVCFRPVYSETQIYAHRGESVPNEQ